MMYPTNLMLLDAIRKETTERYLREAQVDHLVGQIKPHRPNRLPKQMCHTLHQMGHLLTNLGERLEQSTMTQVI